MRPGRVLSHETHKPAQHVRQCAARRGPARYRPHIACQAVSVTTIPRITSVPLLDDSRGLKLQLDAEDDRDTCNIVSRYSPAYVRSVALAKPEAYLDVLGRIVRIVTKVGLFFGSLWYDKLVRAEDTPERVRLRASQLRVMLCDLGPSFIKAGQVLASRPDIMREDYMNELCKLQDAVPPFSDVIAFEMMEDALGRPIAEVFSSISERPIAAASLGQVYKAVLRDTGEEVAIKVQRPAVEPVILRDLLIFRTLATFFDPFARKRLGCSASLIVDEFGEKLLEELDYTQEARNIQDFGENFRDDPSVKIPWVRRDLSGRRVLVMEWIDGIRCTDPDAIRASGLDVAAFIRCGVVAGLRQLLEFGLFHGDPHPGNVFALRDGRIAYVDFGNVAELSERNKGVLIEAVVHAVNEDYEGMAGDFIKLGFLQPGIDITPIVPALERIWVDSKGQSLADFNFRVVTSKFNELVYQYPIRIPERYSLVIRSLLTQEGICLTLQPDFHFLEVAYPYVARRLLTDENPQLRNQLILVLFQNGKFQWKRLENLLALANEDSKATTSVATTATALSAPLTSNSSGSGSSYGSTTLARRRPKMDLGDTIKDAIRVILTDERLRSKVVLALTEDNRLAVDEVLSVLRLVQSEIDTTRVVRDVVREVPNLSRSLLLGWADRVLTS